MRKFRLTADAIFYAEGIDNAFDKLSKYFNALKYDQYSALDFEAPSQLHLQPQDGGKGDFKCCDLNAKD